MAAGNRAGFTLLEVLLATSILLGSLIVLEELARLGRRNARDAEETALSQALAHARMNEIVIGAAPFKTVRPEPIPQAPDWTCAVTVQPVDSPGLAEIVVTVAKGDSSGGARAVPTRAVSGASGERSGKNGRERSFTLIQWMRRPNADESGLRGLPMAEATRPLAGRNDR